MSTANAKQIKINLICPANGKGLEIDGNVLLESLSSLRCSVNWIQKNNNRITQHSDINLFCEQLDPSLFSSAHLNWFIPNPEYYFQDMAYLNNIDLILCRTREVERIFRNLGKKTFFLGFTTPDTLLTKSNRDYTTFIHVAGSSSHKGTQSTVSAWQKNSQLPLLTVIRTLQPIEKMPSNVVWKTQRLAKNELQKLQNCCGIHLCLSETEGFGHSLMEALSCRAVVITTDAPPMNEMVKDLRCLVPYYSSTRQNLGTKYQVADQAIDTKVREILALPLNELKAIGVKNRIRYLDMKKTFHQNLKYLISKTKKALLKLDLIHSRIKKDD